MYGNVLITDKSKLNSVEMQCVDIYNTMEQKHINQLEREQEYSTGEREMTMPKKKEEEPWADTLEEANE